MQNNVKEQQDRTASGRWRVTRRFANTRTSRETVKNLLRAHAEK